MYICSPRVHQEFRSFFGNLHRVRMMSRFTNSLQVVAIKFKKIKSKTENTENSCNGIFFSARRLFIFHTKSFMLYLSLQGRGGSLLKQSSLSSNFVSDVTIGSLPRGLSGAERQKLFQSVPLSPTLNLLSSMPSVCSLAILLFKSELHLYSISCRTVFLCEQVIVLWSIRKHYVCVFGS